jgi:uncharacterized protein (TIGR03437 family)
MSNPKESFFVNLSIVGRAGARLAMTAFLLTPVLSMAQVKVAPGTITTIAGNQALGIGYTGDGAAATSAQLNLPFQAVFAGGNLYISDQVNNVIRYVTGSTGIITTIAGDNIAGYTKDGVAATTSELSSPTGIWVDSSGDLYIADTGNAAVRMVNTKGIISTVAGVESTPGYQGDGFGALSAELLKPSSVAFDSAGNMYIADSGNNVIRKVTPSTAANPDVISTYAGLYNGGVPGYLGDGKPATEAELSDPVAIALDSAGNLYIADSNNSVIRKVTASTGIITTIAGQGPTASNYFGDGGPAIFAHLDHPKGVAVDAAGNVYISDTFNQRIRMVSPNGIINTVVGTGVLGYSGDGGAAVAAQLNFPAGLSIDSAGNIYIADNGNSVIRQYLPPSASAGGVISASSFGAFSAIAPGSWIEIYGSNLASTTGSWSNASFTGVNAPTSLDGTTVTVGGSSAFIDYVSPGQVNAQVPSGVGSGSQQLVVTTSTGQKTTYTVTVNPTEPGLWAPAAFQLSGKQYVGAQLSDGSWALPSAVSGYTSRVANVGETMTMYGVGFGPVVNPTIPAGQIVQQQNQLAESFQIYFGPVGQNPAQMTYSGLAPGLVGVYQFNVVVPNIPQNIAVPLTFVLGGTNSAQTLYTAVQ